MALRILLGSNNPGKLAEFERILAGLPVDLMTPADAGVSLDVAEIGATYLENARIKARAYASASGLTTIADDSGLEVDALNGRPGVLSARYGGEDLTARQRFELLLAELAGVPRKQRAAWFRAVLVLRRPDGAEASFEGTCEGTIALQPRGDRGFGYDPVFQLPDGRTMAELPPEEKDLISHRGRAAALLREYLVTNLGVRGEGADVAYN
jgi:XTP/dITP diphosphohydrolase